MSIFDRSLKSVLKRDWVDLRSRWLSHIPEIQPEGSGLAGGLNSIQGLEDLGSQALSAGEPVDRVDLPGVREAVLHEGIFFLHKALHVIGVAETAAVNGMATWSLGIAYQASVFSARAVLCFLGIDIFEANNKTIMIDCWTLGSIKKGARGVKEELRTVSVRNLGHDRPDHRALWRILQRALRVARIDLWPELAFSKLRNIDEGIFARQRNALHYRSDFWVYEDLHSSLCPLNFGDLGQHKDVLAGERKDFSMTLGLLLANLAAELMRDLCLSTNRLNRELALVDQCLVEGRHPLLMDFRESAALLG